MTIETGFDSNYRKVLVAARRARQLQSGAHALVATHSTKPCRIAQDEISAGKISYVKADVRSSNPRSRVRPFLFSSAKSPGA
jgi:DNA-directed RNA polymerase subunit omega